MTSMTTDTEQLSSSLKEVYAHKHAKVSLVEGKPVAVIEATSNYIPIEEFQDLFNKAGEIIKENGVTKLVFDKRKLTVFHQPSMEWYFTDWKEHMFDAGLKTHRKILPNNTVFQESVRIGREKIDDENPNLRYHKMDIQYKNTLQEAIDQ